jgi:2-oxo-4-hydroxy-4-carboxy--5-ureidoimidazoline (OHCU) decarboxylase
MSRFQTLQPSTLSRDAFVNAFADIYEHSPWVAEKAYDLGRTLRSTRSKPCTSA